VCPSSIASSDTLRRCRSSSGSRSRYDVGIEHLAFEVDGRVEADAAHERCVADGARVHFPPEDDRDVDGYYAFFVFDPDGMSAGNDNAAWHRRVPFGPCKPLLREKEGGIDHKAAR
jgi:catechol 2,3-dioxygenase-like lactoylglutathione lyase family enzyme